MAIGVQRRPRAPAPAGPAGDSNIGPGFSGTAVAPSGPVDASASLNLDPTHTGNFPPPSPNPALPTPSSLVSQHSAPSDTIPNPSSHASSGSGSSHLTTILIVAVAGGVFVLFAIAVLFVMCRRSSKKSRRMDDDIPPEDRKRDWQEIDSLQSPPTRPGPDGVFADYKHDESYRGGGPMQRPAPPTLGLQFHPQEPHQQHNPFDPHNPYPYAVQPLREPPAAAMAPGSQTTSRAPSEYSVSYYRTISSPRDSQAMDTASTRSTSTAKRASLVKRSPSQKVRHHKELIALDKLIAALDLNAQGEKERMLHADPANDDARRDSYLPTTFPLPDPAVFRAALGTGSE